MRPPNPELKLRELENECPGGGGGTRKGAHFRLRAYDKVGILPVEVYEIGG